MSKWRKIASVKRTGHSLRRLVPILRSPKVPMKEKLLFTVPALVYWIVPDVLPYMPWDDIAVSLLLLNAFTERAERKFGV